MEFSKRRSLILAGGGIKVPFQAGVLQVWLDEAGLCFHHVDGASGGTFNLAMYCQGMSGTQIADRWRSLHRRELVRWSWSEYAKLVYAASLGTRDALRQTILPAWGIDWAALRKSPCEATFNVYNCSKHRLDAISPADMTEEHLIAGVSLPMWFPPVRIRGDLYMDAMFAAAANLEEAIRRGAEELWIIWTVSDRNGRHEGFIGDYFQIIEASARSQLKRVLCRIERNNTAIAAGEAGEFERRIEVKMLKAEVPLHHLVDLRADCLREAVDLGAEKARAWCREQGVPLRPPAPAHLPAMHQAGPQPSPCSEESPPLTDYFLAKLRAGRLFTGKP